MNLKKLYDDKMGGILKFSKFEKISKKPGNERKHRTIKCRTIRCLSQKFYFKRPNGKHFVFSLTDRVFPYFEKISKDPSFRDQLIECFHMKNNFFRVHVTLTFPIFCASYESVKFIQLCRGR